ncbi:MAG: transposase, partial [Pseudomonadota bacterium]
MQLLQALHTGDHQKRFDFCSAMLEDMEDDNFSQRLVFSDESTFHLSGKVNRHNVRIWGSENPCVVVQHERDSPKLNVFCAMSVNKVYGPFFFAEKTVTGISYLDMLENWLFPQVQQDLQQFLFMQDGAPPHFHSEVRRYLNETIPRRWIGRGGQQDLFLRPWPPRSPDLTPCDFYLWGYVKGKVFVPPMPNSLEDLKQRIVEAVRSV